MSSTANIVLVAGGTGALGRAVTLAFLKQGAGVVVTYILDEEFASLHAESGANASRLIGKKIDVTEENAVHQLIAEILRDHGRLDVLVNTVGGYEGGKKLWEADSKTLDR